MAKFIIGDGMCQHNHIWGVQKPLCKGQEEMFCLLVLLVAAQGLALAKTIECKINIPSTLYICPPSI
jgi:hypothetical protein